MTTAEARRQFGTNARIARICGIHRASVTKWGRMVPKERVPQLMTAAAMMGMERGLGGDPDKLWRA